MKNLIYFFIILFFVSCGGGSSSSVTNEKQDEETITITIIGKVIDAAIKGASVCLDLNINGNCDSTEPKTTSLEDGSFSFPNTSLVKNKIIPIISVGGTDTAVNVDYKGELKASINTSNTIFSTMIVSPLSDLIVSSYLKGSTLNELELNQIQNKILTAFNFDNTVLNYNPMTNKELFSKVQELEHIKAILETAVLKHKAFTSIEKVGLREHIKVSIVKAINSSNTLVFEDILEEVESLENINFLQEEKTFLISQFNGNKTTFDEISTSSSFSMETLPILQNLIYEEIKEVHNAINSSTYTSIKLSSTEKLISKSMIELKHIEGKSYKTPPILPSIGD